MKKVAIHSFIWAVMIAAIVWGASLIFAFSYGEWSFLIGLGLSVVLYFFNSSGGVLSKMAAYEASETGWKIQKDSNELKANVGPLFFGSVLYTLISFIATIILYF
ncbi:hypothetical protein GCM10008986_20140 [Salinibacillus aidingensis]|uniref:DUF3899 domain-containing protein n=1 Tax=Salinibacillus aidingensis TaxID=237684 RepID=A0ABN1BAY3_9BACI